MVRRDPAQRKRREKEGMKGFLVCLSPCIRHQSTTFKVLASLPVQFCPMTAFPSWWQSLCQSSIWELLQCRVNPTETKCFFNDFYVWKSLWLWSLWPVTCHPTTLFWKMILLKPFPQLLSFWKWQQVCYFHVVCNLFFSQSMCARFHFSLWLPNAPICLGCASGRTFMAWPFITTSDL